MGIDKENQVGPDELDGLGCTFFLRFSAKMTRVADVKIVHLLIYF